MSGTGTQLGLGHSTAGVMKVKDDDGDGSFESKEISSPSRVPLAARVLVFHTELEVLSVQFSDALVETKDCIYGTIIIRASGVDYVIFNRTAGDPSVLNSDGHISFNPSYRFIRMTDDDIMIYVFLFELEYYGIMREDCQSLLWSARDNPDYDGKVFTKVIPDDYFGPINVEFRVCKHNGLFPRNSPYQKVLWEFLSPSPPLISNVQPSPTPMPYLPYDPADFDELPAAKEVAAWGPEYVWVGGRQLADIFSVRFLSSKKDDLDQMYGALLIRGTGRPYVVFHRIIGDAPVVDSKGTVRLVGPKRCIQVDDYFTMDKCLFDYKLCNFQIGPEDLLWFDFSHKSMYGTIMKKRVESKFGPIEVKYAVYKRAAEGILSVTLMDWNAKGEDASMVVHGKVFARNTDFEDEEAQIHLFNVKSEEAIRFECANAISLPLTRSAIALPLGCSFFPESRSAPLSVSICLYKNDIMVSDGSLKFSPSLSGEEQKILSSQYNTSKVAVNVRWLKWWTDH